MNVGELCNREVGFARRDTGLVEGARLMREHHVGALVVVVDEQPAGRVPVGDVMSAGALIVRDQDGIADALRVMREKGVRRLPVVTNDGTLAGVLAIDDLLELVAEEMDSFVHTLRAEGAREARVRK